MRRPHTMCPYQPLYNRATLNNAEGSALPDSGNQSAAAGALVCLSLSLSLSLSVWYNWPPKLASRGERCSSPEMSLSLSLWACVRACGCVWVCIYVCVCSFLCPWHGIEDKTDAPRPSYRSSVVQVPILPNTSLPLFLPLSISQMFLPVILPIRGRRLAACSSRAGWHL